MKCETMARIKKRRKFRDEVLTCKNEGRLKYLIIELPEVTGYTLTESWNEGKVEVTLREGYQYTEHGDSAVKALVNIGLFLYHRWRKEYLKKFKR